MEIAGGTLFFALYLFQVLRLYNRAKKHHNYLYRKYQVTFVIQSICILVGIVASVLYHTLLFYNRENAVSVDLSMGIRILQYASLIIPVFTMSMVMRPMDLFAEFNMYPEQLSRVSIVQYTRFNYNRFENNPQINQSNERGLFGLSSSRMSTNNERD